MNKFGNKHLVECHCVLPIYKDNKPIIYHKFAVYSKLDENGRVIPKYANCNNCGILHSVYELCKSNIKVGKEDIASVTTIDEIALSFPGKLNKILEKYTCTINIYEEIDHVLEDKIFPTEIILSREIIEDEHHVKIIEISGNERFKIKSEKISTIIK